MSQKLLITQLCNLKEYRRS